MHHQRVLQLAPLLAQRSLFLFGPRQAGKTTLIHHQFPGAMIYNLNHSETFRELSAKPELIRLRLQPEDRLVIVDEIQKLPVLLNEMQAILDADPRMRVLLTGSSARTLRRGGVNLLGGRARTCHLFPLVSAELPAGSLDRRLAYGSLPPIFNSTEPDQDLGAYVGAYLQLEVRAEGLVRSIETFSRFLQVAGLSNGQILNFTEVGSDAGVPPRTVREHFQILEDTMLGHLVPAYRKTVKRKPVASVKFYFFDVGVARFLAQQSPPQRGTPQWGAALEHQVYLECIAWISYRRFRQPVCYWRSRGQVEVDFVIGDSIGIEVKATPNVQEKHLNGLRALAEDVPMRRRIVVSLERAPRRTPDGIEILPAEEFFRRLWAGEYSADLEAELAGAAGG